MDDFPFFSAGFHTASMAFKQNKNKKISSNEFFVDFIKGEKKEICCFFYWNSFTN